MFIRIDLYQQKNTYSETHSSLESDPVLIYKFFDPPEFCLEKGVNTGYGLNGQNLINKIDHQLEANPDEIIEVQMKVCKNIPGDLIEDEVIEYDSDAEESVSTKSKKPTSKKLSNAMAQLGMSFHDESLKLDLQNPEYELDQTTADSLAYDVNFPTTNRPKTTLPFDQARQLIFDQFRCHNDVNYDIKNLNGKVDLERDCTDVNYLESFNNTKFYENQGYDDCIYYITVVVRDVKTNQISNNRIGKFFYLLNPVTVLESLGEMELVNYFPGLSVDVVKTKLLEKGVDTKLDKLEESLATGDETGIVPSSYSAMYSEYTFEDYLANYYANYGQDMPTKKKFNKSTLLQTRKQEIMEKYKASIRNKIKNLMMQQAKDMQDEEKRKKLDFARKKAEYLKHRFDENGNRITIHDHVNADGSITRVDHSKDERIAEYEEGLLFTSNDYNDLITNIEPYIYSIRITTRNRLNHIHVKYTIPRNTIVCRYDYACNDHRIRKFLKEADLFPPANSKIPQKSTRNIDNFIVFYNDEKSCWEQSVMVNMTCSNGLTVNDMVNSNLISIGKAPKYKSFRQILVAENWNIGKENEGQMDGKPNGDSSSTSDNQRGKNNYSFEDIAAAFGDDQLAKKVERPSVFNSDFYVKFKNESLKAAKIISKEDIDQFLPDAKVDESFIDYLDRLQFENGLPELDEYVNGVDYSQTDQMAEASNEVAQQAKLRQSSKIFNSQTKFKKSLSGKPLPIIKNAYKTKNTFKSEVISIPSLVPKPTDDELIELLELLEDQDTKPIETLLLIPGKGRSWVSGVLPKKFYHMSKIENMKKNDGEPHTNEYLLNYDFSDPESVEKLLQKQPLDTIIDQFIDQLNHHACTKV